MDVLASYSIFQELQLVHDTGYFSAMPSLEENWQQVKPFPFPPRGATPSPARPPLDRIPAAPLLGCCLGCNSPFAPFPSDVCGLVHIYFLVHIF